MKNRITQLWLCSLALTLCLSQLGNAQDLDFNVLTMPAQDEISFDILAKNEQQLPAEAISFAVLDCSKCDCETTGVCLCDDCTCENCPNKDTRPVITVKTMPNCPPCKLCKKDSETLTQFRWVFVEQDEVEDGAPRLEWQGLESRWALNGWFGAESFQRSYERSQEPKVATLEITRPVYRTPAPRFYSPPIYRSFVPACRGPSCSGGMCRTCR